MSEPTSPRVLVTRAAEDAPVLSHTLGEAGFLPVEVPAIERIWEIDAVVALAARAPFADVLVITSGTVADVVATAAPAAWRNARVAVVGKATRARVEALGGRVDLVPERATAADLVAALGDLSGALVVWPHGDLAPSTTAEALVAAGAKVETAIAYRNQRPANFDRRIAAALPVQATTLMSGSAASRLAASVPEARRRELGKIVVIGPSTHAVAVEAGLEIHAVASPHSISGMLEALRSTLGRPIRP